jgi:dihydrodipicolinate synthase/N-acetylneuraminate lyase
VAVYEHARASRWKEAHATQLKINDLIELTLRFPPLAAVKKILAWSGIDCGACVRPRRLLTTEEEQKLRALLVATGFQELAGAA